MRSDPPNWHAGRPLSAVMELSYQSLKIYHQVREAVSDEQWWSVLLASSSLKCRPLVWRWGFSCWGCSWVRVGVPQDERRTEMRKRSLLILIYQHLLEQGWVWSRVLLNQVICVSNTADLACATAWPAPVSLLLQLRGHSVGPGPGDQRLHEEVRGLR